jgi:serine/threonine protein kinase
MSRCPAPDHLERFLAQRLDSHDHAITAAHVRDCPDCRDACSRLAANHEPDTVTLGGPPPPADPSHGCPAPADAPTARLWRHELVLRPGERPVKSGSAFDITFPPWPASHTTPAVPGYELLGELGRGGMGVVFKARQVKLNRLVALKMIHGGELSDPDTLARFRTEAEAVARLQHPNIVQIYEVGEADGRPFFSLEYVGGGSLAQRAGGRPQPPVAAATLVEVLARAVDYAHSQGIIHRDLKPGNILLADDGQRTEDKGQRTIRGPADVSSVPCPLSSVPPKIADFGLAKSTTAVGRPDRPLRPELIVGTPQYMAPEMAGADPEDVGPHADVYALGAILYELLTGRPPFQGANATDTLLHVRLLEPIPPRVWHAKTPRDLETISLKCLAKNPRLRYSSARDLADDLRRFLEGVPIRARESSLTERAWKAVRRHPVVAMLGLTGALAMLIGFADVARDWRQADARRVAAERTLALTAEQLDRTEQELYVNRITQAHDDVRAGRFDEAANLLHQCQPPPDRPDRRGWEWHYLNRYRELGHDPVEVRPAGGEQIAASGFRGVVDEGVSPDGRRMATIGPDATVLILDAVTRRPMLTLRLPANAGSRPRLEFGTDARLTATWSGGTAVWTAGT